MYALKVGSRYVVLDNDSTLSLEINNPLFETDLLPGDWSLPFTVPDHPENDITFNLPKDISNVELFEQDYDADLYIGGTLYSLGRINVTRAENGRYSLVFGSEVSRLKAALENKKLNEFDYGGVRTFGTTSDHIIAHAKTTALADPLDYDYTFPSIYNDLFYGSSQQDNPYYLYFLNTYDAAGAAYKKNVVVTTESAANKYTLAPQPYLQYILKQLFSAAGFILKGDFIDDAQMQKLLVYSNYSLDKKTSVTHHSKAILGTGYTDDSGLIIFDNDSTGDGTDPDNDYDTTTGEYTIPEAGYYSVRAVIDITQILPRANDLATDKIDYTLTFKRNGVAHGTYSSFVYWNVPFTIDKTFTGFFPGTDIGAILTIEFSVTRTPLFGGTTPLTVNLLPDTTYFDVTILSQSELNKFSNDINIANHVPDMLATDFVLSIFEILLIKMKPLKGTNIIELNYADEIINNPAYNNLTPIARPNPSIEKEKPEGNTYNFDFPTSDFYVKNNFIAQTGLEELTAVDKYSDLPAAKPNTFIRIKNVNHIYKTFFNEGTGLYDWQYASDNYYEFIKPDGANEVKPSLSPVIMREQLMLSVNGLYPAFGEEGSSLAFANGYRPQSNLRLMFYHGMRPNASSNNYPYASATRYDYQGNEVGAYNLQWDGDDGLFTNFHKSFFDFMQKARFVTHQVDFTTAHLTDIDIFKRQLIAQTYYFISRIRVNLTPTSIDIATVETYSQQ